MKKVINHIMMSYLLLVFAYASHVFCLQASSKGYTYLDCTFNPIVKASERPDGASARKFHFTHPHVPVKEGTSQNWSGYVAATKLTAPASDSVTVVAGSWFVPAISKASHDTFCSLWVGIDGFSNGTVEQIGTEHDWTSSGQSNYAWFEMYPGGSYEITGFPVNVNDIISASVTYTGKGVFQLTIFNNSKKVYTAIPTAYTKSLTALRSSAEWVLEAPYDDGILPLSHFGTANFNNCYAIINNATAAISNSKWAHEAMTMVTGANVTKAVPSALSANGYGFSVAWKHE